METKTTITVREIVEGQKNLDRMKKEVNQVIHSLLGFAHSHFSETTFRPWSIISQNIYWKLILTNESFLVKFCFHGNELVFDRNDPPLPLFLIEKIFDELPLLIKMMFEVFPDLHEEMKYHRSASKKQF